MILQQLIIFSVFLYATTSSPLSYQYVSFSNGGHKFESPGRHSRSFGFSNSNAFSEEHVWNSDDLHPHFDSLTFEEHHGHFTPDFSNGLNYPDPLLLTGPAAKRKASLLYHKPLFFGDIDHVSAIRYNQQERRRNGLAGNKLGSLRPHLPFYRFKEFPFFKF